MKILDKHQVSKFVTLVTIELRQFLLRNGIDQPIENFLGVDIKKHTPLDTDLDIAAEQIDALVDICYYILNHITKEKPGISINEDLLYVLTDITDLNVWFKRVYQFTSESDSFFPKNSILAEEQDRIQFLTRMVLSEVWELCDTVTRSSEETRELILAAMKNNDDNVTSSFIELDPLVCILEKCYDISGDMDLDINTVFNLVHQSNMNKKDPVTGKFQKRADGKIIKPANWIAPDIKAEIQRQMLIPKRFKNHNHYE